MFVVLAYTKVDVVDSWFTKSQVPIEIFFPTKSTNRRFKNSFLQEMII